MNLGNDISYIAVMLVYFDPFKDSAPIVTLLRRGCFSAETEEGGKDFPSLRCRAVSPSARHQICFFCNIASAKESVFVYMGDQCINCLIFFHREGKNYNTNL